MGDTLNLATLARDSETPSGDTSGPVVVERRHRVSLSSWCSIKQSSGLIQLQETSHQDSDSKIESNGSAKEDTPVGLRTRSRMQQQTPSATYPNEDGPERQTESEIKDLLLQLIAQTKEQQSEVNGLRLALKNGLEQLETVVCELKGDIAELQIHLQTNGKANAPISEPQPLVKPFKPSGKENVGDTPSNLQKSEVNLRLAGKQDVIQRSKASPVLTAKAYKVNVKGTRRQDSPSGYNADQRSTNESDEDAPCDTSSNLDPAEPSSKLPSKKCQRRRPGKPSSRAGGWRQGGAQPTKSREDGFEPPKETEAVRTNAGRMIEEALNQVPDAVHYSPKSKKTVVTLYAGNLDFKANCTDILETLRKHFGRRIQVNEMTIANHQGRSKGYGFVTLSWAQEAEVDPGDICKLHSGMIQVKSRRLYFQELRDDVADKEHERAYTTRNGLERDGAGGYCLGDGIYQAADGTFIVKWN